jgi:hypothetical protein
MADPLTSSDIIRERLGFGPRSPEERQRAAAAGISPLGAIEREKFERGGGPSPMATRTEKEAWQAAEVQAGRRSPMELPESYGGMGERPEATTRRGLRMQQEWDKQREMMIQEQEAARRAKLEADQFDLQVRQENRLINEQDARRNAERLQAKMDERNASVKNRAFGIMAEAELDDPLAYSRVVEQLSDISGALEDEDVRSALGIIQKASESGQGSLIRAQQKEINSLFSEARQLGVSEKQLSTVEDIDDSGNTFTDVQKLQKLIDTTKGTKAVREEERKEKGDEYKPMSVEQAKDEVEVAQAEFDAIEESETEDDDPSYVRAQSRLRRAEAQLKVSQGRTKETKKPKELGPVDQSDLNWANANPDDPRSSRIKQRLGVE